MEETSPRPFSQGWVFASIGIFIAVELALAAFIGPFMRGAGVSHVLREKIYAVLNVSGYLVGGILVGVISPGMRLLEPAIAAFLAVAITLTISFFTPYYWFRFSLAKMLLGGAIAFAFALAGAHIGESWTEKRRAAGP